MSDNKARERILKAAKEIFSEKGFDGARMDPIAQTAGVNKALIYYYFKSKRELFDGLIEDFMVKTRDIILRVFKDIDLSQEGDTHSLFDQVFHYLEEHEAVIRMVMLESLKKGSSSDTLFQIVDMYLGSEEELLETAKSLGILQREISMDQMRVTEFFTLFGPIIMLILLQDDWVEYYKMNKEDLHRQFSTALEQTHVRHHRG